MTDHRQHPRKPLETEIAFRAGEGPLVEARCRDISLGGMFIETDQPLPYGAALKLFIRLPGAHGEHTIEAIVRWSKPNGMGVQFGRMGARETHGLALLLASR